jgi:hypothetical protein
VKSVEYKIRDYIQGDERLITSLFEKVFGKPLTTAQWKWKYAVPGEGRIYSKVIEDESRSIIGHAGAVPLRGTFQQRPLQFFQIADVMIHPGARGSLGRKNLFGDMVKKLFEDIRTEFPEVFCYGFPGRRPYLLGERVGVYAKIAQGTDCLKYLWPSFPFRSVNVQELEWHERQIDTLWDEISGELGLTVIRDSRYLLWRYADNPFHDYRLLGFFRSGRLLGWAVIKEEGEEVLVVDLLVEPKRCREVLQSLFRKIRASGTRKVRIWLPGKWSAYVRGGQLRETEVVVTNMIWKLPLDTSVVKESLYYTMGDVDIF